LDQFQTGTNGRTFIDRRSDNVFETSVQKPSVNWNEIHKGGPTMARESSRNREQVESVQPRQGQQVSRPQTGSLFTPFSMIRRFADEMDRMFEGFGFPGLERSGLWSSAASTFSPEIDIFERDGKLVLRADLPGMTKEDVRVDILEDSVVIEGERKYEHEENEKGMYRSERTYGRFHRQVPLPEGVKTENATASFKNGVLEVVLDATQIGKNRRRLEIQGDESSQKPGQTAA
jgi:HSP20 family protein